MSTTSHYVFNESCKRFLLHCNCKLDSRVSFYRWENMRWEEMENKTSKVFILCKHNHNRKMILGNNLHMNTYNKMFCLPLSDPEYKYKKLLYGCLIIILVYRMFNVLEIITIWFLFWISQIFYIFGLIQNIWQFETSTLGLEVIIRFLWSPYEKILAYASKKEECNFYDNVIAVKERRLIADINRSCI